MPRPTPRGSKRSLAAFPLLILLSALLAGFAARGAQAADLPLASSSPLAGLTFDDRPLVLPVQQNFQMAMLTVGSELGRSCARMEAYGWRVASSEQARVNRIFNSTVDRLRGLGYEVEAQAPASISRDITVFTADRQDRHFLFIWSAGEIGLVMTLCETSAPAYGYTPRATNAPLQLAPTVIEAPPAPSYGIHAEPDKFSPVGSWIGNYTCNQGYTGATLDITSLKGGNFQGAFHFYPTPKNPYAANGRYVVYGQYDAASHRILVNPGAWIERPQDYYTTIMVGSFDPVTRTLSAYFQGVTGCTSFEAKYASDIYKETEAAKAKEKPKAKPVMKKKPKPKKKPVPKPATPPAAQTPTAAQAPAAAPAATAPAPAAPGAAPSAPDSTEQVPAATAAPGAVPSFVPPSAPAPAREPGTVPAFVPPSTSAPEAPSGGSAPDGPPAIMLPSTAPHSEAKPPKEKLIRLAQSGSYFTPISPQAPPAQPAQPAPIAPMVGAAPGPVPAPPAITTPLQAPNAPVADLAPPQNYVAPPLQTQPANIAYPAAVAPGPETFLPQPQEAPLPQYVPDPGSPPKP